MTEPMFSPAEIVRIAVNVEKNGQVLFGLLEQKATDKKIQDLWRYLKEQEIVHQKIFEEILEHTDTYIVDDYNPGEYAAYVRAIASEYILTQRLVEQKVKELFPSDLDAIDFGIFIEKESIMTYTALRDYVKTAYQETIDKVIAEEKKHLVNLCAIKKTITG
jgi:rubrerythrin